MNQSKKPQIVPTLLSSRVLVWSVVLVVVFVGLTMFYFSCLGLWRARQAYAEPVSTEVSIPAISVHMPKGWQAYATTEDSIFMFRSMDASGPRIRIVTRQSEALRYQALDSNRALLLRRISKTLAAADASIGGSDTNQAARALQLNGENVMTVRPGVSGVYFMFTQGERVGGGLYFLHGDRSYLIFGTVDKSDVEAGGEILDFITRPQESIELPSVREDIERPVVDSSLLTAERNREILAEVGRELAMWRLFSERAETEPQSALLPAINHFREAVRLLASVRQEATILSGKDFERYRALCVRRQATLREWFVLLDKYRAMNDREGAKRQAEFIREHATLLGEAPDARRALDIYNELVAEELQSQQGGVL